MNKKGYLIMAVICGLTLLAAVGVGVYSLIGGSDNPPGEVPAETETVGEVDSDTTDTVWNDETVSESEDTEADTIPAIKEDPKLPDVQGRPVIDVEEMTRNPNAEVVDSKIEYGTKEADTYEE